MTRQEISSGFIHPLRWKLLRVSQNPSLPFKIRQLDETERGPFSPDI